MQNSKLASLARATNCSMATVSQVLNHKGHVRSETRERILRQAEAMHALPQASSKQPPDVYVILPQIPDFFWGEMYRTLTRALEKTALHVTYHMMSKCMDSFMIRYYLTDAVRQGAKTVLIAARIDAETRDALADCITHCPVFFISEKCEDPHIYYFGTNAYEVGIRLAQACNDDGVRRVALTNIAQESMAGFLSTFQGESELLTFDDCFHSSSASIFARLFAAKHTAHPFDAVVCLDAFADCICLAMQKLKLYIPCYGLENPPTVAPYLADGRLSTTICNNPDAISQCVSAAVVQYLHHGILPPSHTYVEPLLVRSHSGTKSISNK